MNIKILLHFCLYLVDIICLWFMFKVVTPYIMRQSMISPRLLIQLYFFVMENPKFSSCTVYLSFIPMIVIKLLNYSTLKIFCANVVVCCVFSHLMFTLKVL